MDGLRAVLCKAVRSHAPYDVWRQGRVEEDGAICHDIWTLVAVDEPTLACLSPIKLQETHPLLRCVLTEMFMSSSIANVTALDAPFVLLAFTLLEERGICYYISISCVNLFIL